HPIGIEATVCKPYAGVMPLRCHGSQGSPHHWLSLLHAKWMVVGACGEFDAASLSIGVGNRGRGLFKCLSITRRNLLEELGLVAATFASHSRVVGHDIGCIAHGPLIGATHGADIAGSAASIFADLTEPAVCPRSCKRLC